jgi:hypothetical protein
VTDWSDYALLLVDVRRDFYPDLVAKPFPDLPGERVVTKQSFDGFLGTDLHEQTLKAYPFVFSRTRSDLLDAERAGWDADLDRLGTLPTAR